MSEDYNKMDVETLGQRGDLSIINIGRGRWSVKFLPWSDIGAAVLEGEGTTLLRAIANLKERK